jgi:hypothetical protein
MILYTCQGERGRKSQPDGRGSDRKGLQLAFYQLDPQTDGTQFSKEILKNPLTNSKICAII